MSSNDTLSPFDAGYVCPPDAGQAWRKAHADGVDLSMIERSLAKSPWQRLLDHDAALRFAVMLREAGGTNDGQS